MRVIKIKHLGEVDIWRRGFGFVSSLLLLLIIFIIILHLL